MTEEKQYHDIITDFGEPVSIRRNLKLQLAKLAKYKKKNSEIEIYDKILVECHDEDCKRLPSVAWTEERLGIPQFFLRFNIFFCCSTWLRWICILYFWGCEQSKECSLCHGILSNCQLSNVPRFEYIIGLRQKALELARFSLADFFFPIDADVFLTNPVDRVL